MKKRNIRTVKKYNPMRFAIEIKLGGYWRQGYEVRRLTGRRALIFDLEYDACAKLLSIFERDFTPQAGG